MAYLTCIGGDGGVGGKKNGAGCRGGWVFCCGRVVIVRYGAVTVHRGTAVRFSWVWMHQKRHAERSVEAATAKTRALVAQKTSPAHGYTRLAPGVKIWPRLRHG